LSKNRAHPIPRMKHPISSITEYDHILDLWLLKQLLLYRFFSPCTSPASIIILQLKLLRAFSTRFQYRAPFLVTGWTFVRCKIKLDTKTQSNHFPCPRIFIRKWPVFCFYGNSENMWKIDLYWLKFGDVTTQRNDWRKLSKIAFWMVMISRFWLRSTNASNSALFHRLSSKA